MPFGGAGSLDPASSLGLRSGEAARTHAAASKRFDGSMSCVEITAAARAASNRFGGDERREEEADESTEDGLYSVMAGHAAAAAPISVCIVER